MNYPNRIIPARCRPVSNFGQILDNSIRAIAQRPDSLVRRVDSLRPGHDYRDWLFDP